MAVDLALGRGMAIARGIGLVLRGAPGVACGGLGSGCGLLLGLGIFQRLPLGSGVKLGLFKLVLDVDEAGALREPPCRAGRGVG